MGTLSWKFILLSVIVAVCLLEGTESRSPRKKGLPGLCKALGCRYVQFCRKRSCHIGSARLSCVPATADKRCQKVNKLALLRGDPRRPQLMRTVFCLSPFVPCPEGTECHGNNCCYGAGKMVDNFKKCSNCKRKCWEGYSCQSIRTRCGNTYTCLPTKKPGLCPLPPPGVVVKCPKPTGHKCKDDASCPYNRKCCKNLCGVNRCVRPVHTKPGKCPMIRASPFCQKRPVQSTCQQDADCKGTQKCCQKACGGKQCSAPALVIKPGIKPGYCPALKTGIICALIAKPDECKSDQDCKGMDKCCKSDCYGLECRRASPVPPRKVIKKGTCPVPKKRIACTLEAKPDQCRGDQDCQGDLKCCSASCSGLLCLTPIMPKKGTCPTPKKGIPCLLIMKPDECKSDQDCKGNDKCCQSDCYGLECRTTVVDKTKKPGYCPYHTMAAMCLGTDPKLCDYDSECTGTKKCCSTLCGGTKCMNKSDKKPGECPHLDKRIQCSPFENITDMCKDDEGCPGQNKCCPTHCSGKMCKDPIIMVA